MNLLFVLILTGLLAHVSIVNAAESSTMVDTTAADTTQEPSTAPVTTNAPTTEVVTTQAETTQAATSEAPTTPAVTTQAATTAAVTTSPAGTTASPAGTTAAPTTQTQSTTTTSTTTTTTGGNPPSNVESDDGALIIIAAVGGTVICILIVLIILALVYLIMKRSSEVRSGSEIRMQLQQMESADEPNAYMPPPPPAFSEADEERYLAGLDANKVKWYIESQAFEIQNEFGYLDYKANLSMPNATTALLSANRHKNRYKNVLPPDESRVKLSIIEEDPNSDYINANWVAGGIQGTDKQYLACQGPLDHTIADFWRMIWEQDISVILMFTRLIELNKLKCSQYWPINESEIYELEGGFHVKLETETQTSDDMLTRKIIIYQVPKAVMQEDEEAVLPDEEEPVVQEDGKEEITFRKTLRRKAKNRMTVDYTKFPQREITQLQYVSWPDHGVPQENVERFAEFGLLGDKYNETKGPILIHCSAGIGRTGTFLLIQNVLAKLRADLSKGEENPKIQLVKQLLEIRKQRTGAIQTLIQYDFCYRAILAGMDTLGVKQIEGAGDSTSESGSERKVSDKVEIDDSQEESQKSS